MTAQRDLVLVGAGHAHVQVLRRWRMAPLTGVRLTLIVDRPEAVYSGMVPGFVAGDYPASSLEIDAVPLARRAGARVVLAAATGIDPAGKRIALAGRPDLPYDVASLDVGATVRGLDLPGVNRFAVPTRPIRTFVDRIDAVCARLGRDPAVRPRVVIVGGGAAGVELAFTLQARLRTAGVQPAVTVLTNDAALLPGYPARVAERVRRLLAARGITLRTRARIAAVAADGIVLDGDRVAADAVVWATGAAPLAMFAGTALPLDADGFVRVGPTLQVEGYDDLFAAGDCAALAWAPWVRKAGVYAVREGPILDANLRARLQGGRLRRYRPQRRTLALLHLGDRRALASKGPFTAVGGWVWHWKDRIDRRFVRRFQVDAAGSPMSTDPMQCGGCAAKVGPTPLFEALARLPAAADDASVLVGLQTPDDAATVRFGSGVTLLVTIDAFRAFTDDPWLVGRVAAINAVSDVFAKGGRPRHALALVTVPFAEPRGGAETLFQVLAGIRAGLDPLGVTLVGGHSTVGPELFVGLSILGEAEAEVLPMRGAQVGDALVLTKPLGTGVVLAADSLGRATGRWWLATTASMLRANAAAAALARTHAAHACTDVSGFGFAGHAQNLLRGSGLSATVWLDAVPSLPGATRLLAAAVRSTFHDQNALLRSAIVVETVRRDDPRIDLLFDPQTSGGLLVALDPKAADEYVRALHAAGDAASATVGVVEPGRAEPCWLRIVNSADREST